MNIGESPPGTSQKRHCLACGTPLTDTRGRQAYCDHACRQDAYRRRHTRTTARHEPALPAARSQRDGIVYACPDCDTRYLGEQRCADCNTFATRLGPGGHCPDCDNLITIAELLGNA